MGGILCSKQQLSSSLTTSSSSSSSFSHSSSSCSSDSTHIASPKGNNSFLAAVSSSLYTSNHFIVKHCRIDQTFRNDIVLDANDSAFDLYFAEKEEERQQEQPQTILEIRTSTIVNAGRGVFTKKKIYENEPVAVYAGLLLDSEDARCCGLYQMYMPNHKTLVGFASPKTRYGLGQLFNDACAHYSRKTYQKYAARLNNTTMDPEQLGLMRAIRDIEVGEELFLTYGVAYWEHHHQSLV